MQPIGCNSGGGKKEHGCGQQAANRAIAQAKTQRGAHAGQMPAAVFLGAEIHGSDARAGKTEGHGRGFDGKDELHQTDTGRADAVGEVDLKQHGNAAQ